MRIDKDCKIQKVAAKASDNQHMLAGAYLDVSDCDDIRLVATNGKALASLPVDAEGDRPEEGRDIVSSCLIPCKAIVAAQAKGSDGQVFVGPTEAKVFAGAETATFPVDRDVTFPDWRKVEPVSKGQQFVAIESIILNPYLLLDLAQAIGCGTRANVKGIKLTFHGQSNAIGVTILGADESKRHALGMIMPMSK